MERRQLWWRKKAIIFCNDELLDGVPGMVSIPLSSLKKGMTWQMKDGILSHTVQFNLNKGNTVL